MGKGGGGEFWGFEKQEKETGIERGMPGIQNTVFLTKIKNHDVFLNPGFQKHSVFYKKHTMSLQF